MLKKSKGKKSQFQYQERSGEDVQKRATQQGGRFDSVFKSGVDRWRPKDGENVIRILPPTWEDHDHYGYDIWVHSFVGPDKSTYLCPQKMKDKPCPICSAAREAKNAGEDDEAKQLGATRRVAAWIIDRDDEKSTPSLFDMSWSMDRDIAALCHNKRTGKVLLIDHPDEGYDVMFSRTGKGLNTRYIGMAVDRATSPILSDEGEQDKMLEYVQENPIPSVLNFYDEDYLKRMIEGGADERDEDLDDDDADVDDGKKRKPAKARRRDEDEEADEEAPPRGKKRTDDEIDADDEATPPKKRATSRRDEPDEDDDAGADDDAPVRGKKPRSRDEDEEEADVEEEEDAPPVKKRATSRREDPEDDDIVEEPDEGEDDDAPPPKKRPPGRDDRRPASSKRR